MPLPTHRLEIKKSLGGRVWNNTWQINVATPAERDAVCDALVEFERRMHLDIVKFEFYVVATAAKDGRNFVHKPINANGYRVPGSTEWLALFNTLRVDMPTLDGDPCRKYMRLPLLEGEQSQGLINSAALTSFNSLITTYLVNSVALDNIVSTEGRTVTGAAAHNVVQERQLARRRRKKQQPA